MSARNPRIGGTSPPSLESLGHDDTLYPSIIPFIIVHLGCFAAVYSGVTWQAIAICVALYWLRMFAITAGYHRYFSHRAFATSRAFQFVLAFLAQSSAQKSVLWWAAKHRHHHLYSDTQEDVHSPRRKGFWYSHLGWIFARQHDTTDFLKVADLARYPELMWLHRFELVPPFFLGLLCFLAGGWSVLVVGFLWSTVLVYHATFCINSLAHVCGRKRYVTADDSRNNWILALFTMGEGWHNNHHAYQSSVRQGFRWWELDATFYVLWALSRLGIVWDLKLPPQTVLSNNQRLGARVINRAAEQLAKTFSAERIAGAIRGAFQGPELSALCEKLTQALPVDMIDAAHMPQLPSREEVFEKAKAMFAKTRSLDEIVERAYFHILASVGAHLAAQKSVPEPSSS